MKDEEVELYTKCVELGLDLHYGKLILCDLRMHNPGEVVKRKYQVHCEHSKYEWSQIYTELKPAVKKFIEIKSKIKK